MNVDEVQLQCYGDSIHSLDMCLHKLMRLHYKLECGNYPIYAYTVGILKLPFRADFVASDG